MNSNIKKIITTMNSIGSFPKKIIIHGVQFACGLLIIALVLLYMNSSADNMNSQIAFTIFTIAKTGVTIFAEAIIGGFIVDYLIKKI